MAYTDVRGDRDGAVESARAHLETVAAELETRVALEPRDQTIPGLLSDVKRTEQSLHYAVASLAGHASATLVARILKAIARVRAVEASLAVTPDTGRSRST